jgi:hypothetical protein
MKAKLVRRITGKVLVEFADGTMDDIIGSSVFFNVSKEDAEKDWSGLWDAVQGGEIYKISPRTDGTYQIQARGEFIDWIMED